MELCLLVFGNYLCARSEGFVDEKLSGVRFRASEEAQNRCSCRVRNMFKLY